MNRNYALKDVREVCIRAYLNGEVDWLAYLEAPSFFVKKNADLISKASQIAYIERSRAKFPKRSESDIAFSETVTHMQQYKHWATVAGTALTKRDGDILSHWEFRSPSQRTGAAGRPAGFKSTAPPAMPPTSRYCAPTASPFA